MRRSIRPLKTVNRVRKISNFHRLNELTVRLDIVDGADVATYIVCHGTEDAAPVAYWSKLGTDKPAYRCTAPVEGEPTCECEGFAHGWSCRHIEATKALQKAGRI